jgi:hypothetical protein
MTSVAQDRSAAPSETGLEKKNKASMGRLLASENTGKVLNDDYFN